MSYFDLYMIAAWSFALGWCVAGIHLQNRADGNHRTAELNRPADTKRAPTLPRGIAAGSSG